MRSMPASVQYLSLLREQSRASNLEAEANLKLSTLLHELALVLEYFTCFSKSGSDVMSCFTSYRRRHSLRGWLCRVTKVSLQRLRASKSLQSDLPTS